MMVTDKWKLKSILLRDESSGVSEKVLIYFSPLYQLHDIRLISGILVENYKVKESEEL